MVKKIFYIIRDIFELYIPIASFIVMFVTFILQVFFRYVINHPLTWSQEIIFVCFVWTVIFGACYTMRRRSHVKFTMLYDFLSPRGAALTRLLGNILIIGTFLALIVPSYKYAFFVAFQKTPIFRLNFTPVFLPFTYFVCSIIGYCIPEVLEDIRVLRGKQQDSKDHSLTLVEEIVGEAKS